MSARACAKSAFRIIPMNPSRETIVLSGKPEL